MNPDATTRLQQAIAGGVIGNLMSPSWSGTPDWPAAQRALQDGVDIDASLICATGWTLLARAWDQELADPRHAAARRRLLARLTADQRLAWLPKSCIAEAAAKTATCRRRP